MLHSLKRKELYFLTCVSYWNYCKTYCFNPHDYIKLFSAVLVALSLSLQGTEMYKLKLISKYLSIIQEKHTWVKADFSMASEKLSNWKVFSLLPLFKCCLPGSEKCSEFITGHREMSSGKRLHATISRFWDDLPSLWGLSAWLVFPWLASTQCRQWGRMYSRACHASGCLPAEALGAAVCRLQPHHSPWASVSLWTTMGESQRIWCG